MDSLTWSHIVAIATSAFGVGGIGYGARVSYLATRDTNDTNESAASADSQRRAFETVAEQQRKDFEVLLSPLRESIAEEKSARVATEEKVATLETKVATLESALDSKETVLRSAVAFIRELLTWIDMHSDLTPPGVPEPLIDDVDPRRIQ